jgi:hypothetical protein
MFFIEKHILSISQNEKFTTKKWLEEYIAIKTHFDGFWSFNIIFCLQHFGFLELNARDGKK